MNSMWRCLHAILESASTEKVQFQEFLISLALGLNMEDDFGRYEENGLISKECQYVLHKISGMLIPDQEPDDDAEWLLRIIPLAMLADTTLTSMMPRSIPPYSTFCTIMIFSINSNSSVIRFSYSERTESTTTLGFKSMVQDFIQQMRKSSGGVQDAETSAVLQREPGLWVYKSLHVFIVMAAETPNDYCDMEYAMIPPPELCHYTPVTKTNFTQCVHTTVFVTSVQPRTHIMDRENVNTRLLQNGFSGLVRRRLSSMMLHMSVEAAYNHSDISCRRMSICGIVAATNWSGILGDSASFMRSPSVLSCCTKTYLLDPKSQSSLLARLEPTFDSPLRPGLQMLITGVQAAIGGDTGFFSRIQLIMADKPESGWSRSELEHDCSRLEEFCHTDQNDASTLGCNEFNNGFDCTANAEGDIGFVEGILQCPKALLTFWQIVCHVLEFIVMGGREFGQHMHGRDSAGYGFRHPGGWKFICRTLEMAMDSKETNLNISRILVALGASGSKYHMVWKGVALSNATEFQKLRLAGSRRVDRLVSSEQHVRRMEQFVSDAPQVVKSANALVKDLEQRDIDCRQLYECILEQKDAFRQQIDDERFLNQTKVKKHAIGGLLTAFRLGQDLKLTSKAFKTNDIKWTGLVLAAKQSDEALRLIVDENREHVHKNLIAKSLDSFKSVDTQSLNKTRANYSLVLQKYAVEHAESLVEFVPFWTQNMTEQADIQDILMLAKNKDLLWNELTKVPNAVSQLTKKMKILNAQASKKRKRIQKKADQAVGDACDTEDDNQAPDHAVNNAQTGGMSAFVSQDIEMRTDTEDFHASDPCTSVTFVSQDIEMRTDTEDFHASDPCTSVTSAQYVQSTSGPVASDKLHASATSVNPKLHTKAELMQMLTTIQEETCVNPGAFILRTQQTSADWYMKWIDQGKILIDMIRAHNLETATYRVFENVQTHLDALENHQSVYYRIQLCHRATHIHPVLSRLKQVQLECSELTEKVDKVRQMFFRTLTKSDSRVFWKCPNTRAEKMLHIISTVLNELKMLRVRGSTRLPSWSIDLTKCLSNVEINRICSTRLDANTNVLNIDYEDLVPDQGMTQYEEPDVILHCYVRGSRDMETAAKNIQDPFDIGQYIPGSNGEHNRPLVLKLFSRDDSKWRSVSQDLTKDELFDACKDPPFTVDAELLMTERLRSPPDREMEISMYMSCSVPHNAVQVHACVWWDEAQIEDKTEHHIYTPQLRGMLMENAFFGSIWDWLQIMYRNKDKWPSLMCDFVCCRVIQCLIATFRAGICSHDIKPANMLVFFDGSIKLCDFGASNHAAFCQHPVDASHFQSTPPFAAPELKRERSHEPFAPDVFSVGVFLLIVQAGNKEVTQECNQIEFYESNTFMNWNFIRRHVKHPGWAELIFHMTRQSVNSSRIPVQLVEAEACVLLEVDSMSEFDTPFARKMIANSFSK
jgi:hypothetical protein